MSRKEEILKKVRALLAKADSTQFEGEAEVFRAKADELMTAYAIEQWQLDVDEGRPEPEEREFDIAWYWSEPRSPARDDVWRLFNNLASHCRCKVVYWSGYMEQPVLGLPSDLDYFDMLFTSLWLQLSQQLEPKPDPDKSMIDNLVAMKEAGMKWQRIGELLHGIGQLDEPYTRKTGVRFTKLYTDYCEAEGRERVYTSPAVYQRNFAEGYVSRVSHRLYGQRRAAKEAAPTSGEGNSMELVVRDIRQVLDQMANEMYGEPPKSRSVSRELAFSEAAYQGGSSAGARADIASHPGRRVGGTGSRQLGG